LRGQRKSVAHDQSRYNYPQVTRTPYGSEVAGAPRLGQLFDKSRNAQALAQPAADPWLGSRAGGIQATIEWLMPLLWLKEQR
jgi:hypothetical protein